MDHINSLHRELKRHLPWHQARLRLMAHVVVALIQVRSVNLTDIALAFSTPVQSASVYKRLQRFLRHYRLDFNQWARLVTRWLDLDERWLLCLDRTTWQFGRYPINILVLGVAYRGVTVPLFWTLLDKKGNSSTAERIALIERFLEVFPVERIQCLTADREFRGQAWLRFLDQRGFVFRLRLPNHTRTTNKQGYLRLPVQRLFALRVRETMVLNPPRPIWGMKVYLACIRLESEHAIIATNQAPETALADYLHRWSIETLFACLKTRGFNLEDTHLRHRERIERLLALLVLAFSWCLKTGLWKHSHKPIRIKKHQRPAKSLFRYGLDHLRRLFFNAANKQVELQQMIQLLSCT
jgi:hypothetical protein